MADRTLPCDVDTPSLHVLTQHLGVGDWLRRVAKAVNVAATAELDKPTYNSGFTIKFAANGSYTFTFPPGTDLAAASGSYALDEQLNISMTPLTAPPPPITVVTLPQGQTFGFPKSTVTAVPTTTATDAARQRLDLIELEQAIRNLQFRQQ